MEIRNNLIVLGWSPFFEQQVTEAEARSFVIARVTAVHKYAFALAGVSGPLAAVVAGKTLAEKENHPDLPVVGDWVLAKPPVGGTAVIVRRLERRSELSRRRPMDRNSLKPSAERQVLASNIDYVFIVMSLNQDLNSARLERTLTIVWNSAATPVVLLSKADLCPDTDAKSNEIQAISSGANVHSFSSLQGQGLPAIRNYLNSGVTGCLIGSSGTGKTTLINALCGTQYKTLTVREDDDKGRHATTSRALFFLPEGGMIIDTPGLREIGLMDDCDIIATFRDIADLAKKCKFIDCTHRVEPDCAVLTALAEGKLLQERYDSYQKLRRELQYQASKCSVHKQQETKKKQKRLGKLIKEYYKKKP